MLGVGINALRYRPKVFSRSGRFILNSKDNCQKYSVANLFNKNYKTLVNIREEWLKKIYPEKDIFNNLNK